MFSHLKCGIIYFKSSEQEKESIIRVRIGKKNPSLAITICYHSASLMMPIGDPWDRFFFPTLTLIGSAVAQ